MLKPETIKFKDYEIFKPNMTPKKMIQSGIFGGTYFRPIYSEVTKKNYKNAWKEFPKSWFSGLTKDEIESSICRKELNKYKVKSGSSLKYWEQRNWIQSIDPYGWFQWYCRFYKGRRSYDDERQIKRWKNFAGENGRWKINLVNKIKKSKKKWNDYSVSPVIRQGLLQWGYELTLNDFNKLK
jgi:hypothetical protein